MFNTNKYARFLYFIVDFLLISLAFIIPCLAHPSLFPCEPTGQRIYLSVFVFWGICLVFILNNLHLYNTLRYLGILEESFIAIKGVFYSSIIAALFVYLFSLTVFSRILFIESVFLLSVFIVLWRVFKRICVRKLISNGFANYNVLLVGIGKETEVILQEINDNLFYGLHVKGILDDRHTGNFCGVKILGKIADLEHIVKKYFIDDICVTDIPGNLSLRAFLEICGKTGKTVRLIIDNLGLPFHRLSLNYLGSIPLITYFHGEQTKANNIYKRIFDLSVGGLALFLFSPVFLAIILLIKIESKGPVLYISERSGRKGIRFKFYKFRSMVYNADELKEQVRHKSEVDGPIFKIKNDPRLTKIGVFLRKHSLDELPQLINVLKGDMSLVGPRPFPVEESEKIEYRHIPRLNVKPGITGLAQVKGRSNLKFNQWMRWDNWYVNNWSAGLDLRILFWTIPAIFRGRGAY
jgi:exopolysaccharide biosynthesis polyprenyl glycosylphosphotransferase